MKLSQCTVFVAIADTGSFTNAAKALTISQSAVSHSIAGLEAALGVSLMTRDRAGVRLTEAGRRVLTHARAVLQHAEQMRRVAGDGALGETDGTIRIGTGPGFAARLLPQLLTDYRAQLPQVEISVREGTDRQITDWLRGYALDVGIVMLPKENLTTVPLLPRERAAVLPVDHPLRRLGIGVRAVARHSPAVTAFVSAAQALARSERSLATAGLR